METAEKAIESTEEVGAVSMSPSTSLLGDIGETMSDQYCDMCGAKFEVGCPRCTTENLSQALTNVRCLMGAIDRIHAAICPPICGSWQDRAKQAVESAERLEREYALRTRHLCEARGALARIAAEATCVLQDDTVSEVPPND